MPDKISFYAIVGGGNTTNNPHGLTRRLETDWGFRTRPCGRTLAGTSRR